MSGGSDMHWGSFALGIGGGIGLAVVGWFGIYLYLMSKGDE